jgi:hypothetical protein
MSKINEITIVTPQTMIYISHIFKKRFQEKNIKCNIVSSKNFTLCNYNKILLQNPNHYYFIYCLFLLHDIENLPVKRYIIYQLEQHTDGRINPYYRKLLPILQNIYQKSFLYFDYNTQNIVLLRQKLAIIPKLLKIPFTLENNSIAKYQNTKKEYDIVFIGLLNHRRRKILNYLKNYFSVGIPSTGIYEKELIDFVCKGKILLNIHFYDNAILERPRLNEMIPIGIPIVSEKPNPKDVMILELYKENVHFIEIIKENNIRKTLVSEINGYFQDVNMEGMKVIENDFLQNLDLYF